MPVIDGTNGLNSGWAALTYAGLGVPTAGPAAYIGKPIAYDSRFITSNPYSSYSQFGTDPISGRNVPNENDLNHWGVAGTLDSGPLSPSTLASPIPCFPSPAATPRVHSRSRFKCGGRLRSRRRRVRFA